jgi:GntR family transcriptional regulator
MTARNWTDLLTIDRQSKMPLYHQIIQNLRELIRSGRLEAGEAVPSEWELADLYGVSRLTVRSALNDLVRDGLLNRRHGVGTFVANPSEAQIFPGDLSFSKNMQQIGRHPSSRVVSIQIMPATNEVANYLDIAVGSPVYEIVRIRLADEEPLMLETTSLSQERFPDLDQADLSKASLYEYLNNHYQSAVVALEQALEPTLLTDREAELLAVKPGSPAILSEMVGFTAEGTPVEYTWSVTVGGRGRFYFYFREGDIGKRHFSDSTSRVSAIDRK